MLSYNIQGFFIDKKNCLQKANIKVSDSCIQIDTYDQNENHTGYMYIFSGPNKKLYLGAVYCFDKYRGYGIASYISELADYLLKDYEGYVIRGEYKPCQLLSDKENNIERSEVELDLRARAFYRSAGYEIVNYEDFLKNPEMYPYLEEEDFHLGECKPGTIVAKPIVAKKHNFFVNDRTIYYDEKSNDLYEEKKLFYKANPNKSKYVKVTIENGENDTITYKVRGEKYTLNDGTTVRAGDTKEQAIRRIDDRIIDTLYSKPVAFVKKLVRRTNK